MDFKALRKTFLNGIFNENPTFRLVLGMCPTLAKMCIRDSIGCPLRPRAVSALRRRVERELFSVVCDVLAVQPLADAAMLPRAADIVLRGVSSRRRLRLDLGQDHVDLWTNCRQALEEAILRFLQPQSYAKTLARLGDSW